MRLSHSKNFFNVESTRTFDVIQFEMVRYCIRFFQDSSIPPSGICRMCGMCDANVGKNCRTVTKMDEPLELS